MKTFKLILFQIFTFLTLGLIIARYGLSLENITNYFTFFNEQILLFLSLIILNLLTLGAYTQTQILKKKNYLKFSSLLLIISTLFFIFRVIKIQDSFDVYILISYIILLIINFLTLKELFKITRIVFLKKINNK